MSEAKDSIANSSTNQQEPDTETQKVESLDNIETKQLETADSKDLSTYPTFSYNVVTEEKTCSHDGSD